MRTVKIGPDLRLLPAKKWKRLQLKRKAFISFKFHADLSLNF